MSNKESSVLFVVFFVSDPNQLFGAKEIFVTFVGFEEGGDGGTSRFDASSGNFFHLHCNCAWTRVELGDVDDWEVIFSDKLQCVFEFFISFYTLIILKSLPSGNPQMMSVAIVRLGTFSRR